MFLKSLNVAFVSCLPFIFSLHGDFVFDDSEAIIKNPDVTCDSWSDPFYKDFWGTDIKSNLSHKSYRPLTVLSFRLNYYLNGKALSPVQFKVANLICHIVCSVLVWLSFDRLLRRTKYKYRNTSWADSGYLAALMFSVHPVHAEAVCGIVGRADVLAAITFFLSFLFYDKSMGNDKLALVHCGVSILFAAISMLFKENGITVLGFCLVYEIVINTKINNIAKIKSLTKLGVSIETIRRILILSLSSVALLYARWWVMGASIPQFKPIDNPAAFSSNFITKVLTYNYVYVLNLVLLLWPEWLCYDWSMGCVPLLDTLLDYRIAWIILVYVYAILILVTLFGRKVDISTRRTMLMCISLGVVPFLPASNLLYAVGFVVAERVLYVPSAGYCLLVTQGLCQLTKRAGHTKRKMILALYYIILIILALRSWQRSYDWQNEYNLFVKGLSVCPRNAKVRYNVAKVADAANMTDWAYSEYKEAISLYPEYYQAMNNLGNLLKSKNKFKEAENYLREAIKHKREFPAAWMNLGIVLSNLKRHDEAEAAYLTALEHRKLYPDCFYNLGNLYLEVNKNEEALWCWRRAIEQNPKHVLAWTNMLALLDNTDRLEEARECSRRALEALPGAGAVHFAAGNVLGKLQLHHHAERHFLRAIQLFGDRVQPIHYANLGVLYHRWKKYSKAEEMYKKALTLNPKFTSAHKNLLSLQKLKY